ncbi:unnamed protein product, partial [marine sediment metagenome]
GNITTVGKVYAIVIVITFCVNNLIIKRKQE